MRDMKVRRPLVANQPLAIDHELVLLGFPAEDWMVVEHEARPALRRMALKEEGRSESADASSHHGQIDLLTGVDRVRRERVEVRVADDVCGVHDRLRVAVGTAIVSDTSVSGPLVFDVHDLLRRQATQQRGARRDECAVQEITSGDLGIHAEGWSGAVNRSAHDRFAPRGGVYHRSIGGRQSLRICDLRLRDCIEGCAIPPIDRKPAASRCSPGARRARSSRPGVLRG